MKFIFSKILLLILLVSCCPNNKLVAAHRVHDAKWELANERGDSQAERALVVVCQSQQLRQQISPLDVCGGILVSSKIVITAAHCFYDPHGLYRRFPHLFGVTHKREDGVFSLRADLLVAHPGYKENGRLNDLGAMRLERSVCEGCLQPVGQSIPLAWWRSDDAKLEMMAFFTEDDHHASIKTKRLPVRWTSKAACQAAYLRWGIHISPQQICIDPLDPQFNHRGESAILLVNDQPIGILSYKLDVSSLAVGPSYIFTDLTRYPDFIARQIRSDAAAYRICSSILYVVISLAIVK